MHVRVLGPVEIRLNDRLVEIGPRQRCLVFAALVVDAGRPVPPEALIDRVWGQAPPSGARRTLQTHIASIRALLTRAGVPEQAVLRRRGGYLFDADPDLVDLHRFRRLAETATKLELAATERIGRWREAVGLWRGEPLAELGGDWVEQARQVWLGEYRDAVLGWAHSEIRAGDPNLVIGPLTDLIGRYPLEEALPAMLMRTWYAAGRRADALSCYAAARQRLEDELAEKPGAELAAVYQAVLRRDPDLPPPPGGLRTETAVPAQLPVDVRGFIGRAEQLALLDTIADAVGIDLTAGVISAIAGTAGVGKTALAVHWAHRVSARFPDGQLYVNLRGFDAGGTVLGPADAIRGFLDALGVPPERIPAEPDAQAALYRTLLADKRMLIVLDNARDTGQVRPLLPGAPGCLVLVTSRNRLTSLVAATAAHALTLDLFTVEEARDLLIRRLGTRRVAAESDAVDALVNRCARLPLALAMAAARIATHPQLPLSALAAELHETATRLDILAGVEPTADLRAVFSWSYAALSQPAARLFRLLGLHPGPDVSVAAVTSLAAVPVPEARRLLAELGSVHLIVEHVPGRYTFHDLLRTYAAELAHRIDSAQRRRAAVHRVLDHYLHTAHSADRLLRPLRDPIAPATIHHAAAISWIDQVTSGQAAVVADWSGSSMAQARAQRHLAVAYTLLGRHDDAQVQLQQALDLYRSVDNHAGQAHAHHSLAKVRELQGRYAEALSHARQAVDLFRATGHRRGEGWALNIAGWHHAHLGQYQLATTSCRQALVLLDELDDRSGQADTWDSLGYAYHRDGKHAEAMVCYRRAVDLFRDLGERYQEAATLTRLGATHGAAGDLGAAQHIWCRALTILNDLDHPDAEDLRSRLHHLG